MKDEMCQKVEGVIWKQTMMERMTWTKVQKGFFCRDFLCIYRTLLAAQKE